jgi:aldehyde dehydrogenase (NAD+)
MGIQKPEIMMEVNLQEAPQQISGDPGFSENAGKIYRSQQAFFRSGATRSHAFRSEQIRKLLRVIQENEKSVMDALYKDLRKSEFEAYGSEIGVLYKEIRHTLDHLRTWMAPRRVPTPMLFFPSRSRIIPDPLGVVLVIGPWNYPFLLMMNPVISAIAGGNTVILKPSDQSVHTSRVIAKIISENFDPSFLAVVEGPGHIVGPELISSYHFDHIFFTGSVPVGSSIMEMAARKLSPVTLELGGKSPCIIDREVDISHAARKVAWSKIFNAGQTCVAPDYVLVHSAVREAFLEKLKAAFSAMLGSEPQKSDSYGRLINRKRFDTVASYLKQGRVVYGGETDPEDLFIAPAILEDISINDSVMQDEIFGPVLPLITYNEREEVLEWIERNPYPLALYLYTSSRETERYYTENVRFGGGCINNGIIHLGNPDLPFGGVGTSGLGQYHGKHGFDTFTRPKSILRTPTWFDVPLWYPPYKDNLKWVKMFFRL